MKKTSVLPPLPDDVVTEKKISVLSIIGFICILVVIAWLGVKAVQYTPKAVDSLASLVDSGKKELTDATGKLTVQSDNNIINNQEIITLNWQNSNLAGTYTFSYECLTGVTIETRDNNGFRTFECDTYYNVGNTDNLKLIITSDVNRFADVNYTIAFLPDTAKEVTDTFTGTFTVVNANIDVLVDNSNDETDLDDDNTEVLQPETGVATSTPTTPKPPVKVVKKYTYVVPTSDPKGYTDLVTKPLGVGYISGNTFIKTGSYYKNEAGAIQFEVKNTGTKTSNAWNYEVALPSGGTYQSKSQVVLKPNERAVITIGFVAPDETGTTPYSVQIKTASDINTANNFFLSAVLVR